MVSLFALDGREEMATESGLFPEARARAMGRARRRGAGLRLRDPGTGTILERGLFHCLGLARSAGGSDCGQGAECAVRDELTVGARLVAWRRWAQRRPRSRIRMPRCAGYTAEVE